MAGSHGVAVGRPRVHPRAQQRLEQVHVQRLAFALSLVLCTCHAWMTGSRCCEGPSLGIAKGTAKAVPKQTPCSCNGLRTISLSC